MDFCTGEQLLWVVVSLLIETCLLRPCTILCQKGLETGVQNFYERSVEVERPWSLYETGPKQERDICNTYTKYK